MEVFFGYRGNDKLKNTPTGMGRQEEFASAKSRHFAAKIADFGLELWILEGNAENSISGSNGFFSVLTDAVKKSFFYGAYSQPMGS